MKGGAIYIDGQSSENVKIQNNKFQKCRSWMGGAYDWQKYRPISQKGNVFLENYAYSGYGNDISSYPQKIQYLTSQQLEGRALKSLSDFQLNKFKSGGFISDLFIVIKDAYDQIVADPDSIAVLTFEVSYVNLTSPTFSSRADSQSVLGKSGVFNLSSVSLVAQPGESIQLKITTNALDLSNPNVNEKNSLAIATVNFRQCIEGQKITTDGQCVECPQEFYLLNKVTEVVGCHQCPENALCFGGTKIGPKPGYWRSNAQSINFIKCYTASACLGALQDDYVPEGKCYQGYQGILCAQCKQNYVSNSNFQCAKCPEKWKNILIIITIMIIAFVVIVLMIKTTLSSMKGKKSNVSVFLKIMTNHLQLIMLTASFNLQWPSQVQSLFDNTRPIADVSSRIFSFDCFLDGGVASAIQNVYVYFLTYLLLPLMICLICMSFWYLKYCKSKDFKTAGNRAISSIIILLFLIHPSITNNIFGIFFCRNIDGQFRLIADLNIICYKNAHLTWSLIGGIPGLLFWAFGIPFFAWILVREQKHRLMNQDVKQKYGFLYNGYKFTSYYWESVIMYRKVAMIFIAVFLKASGSKIQAFVVFLIILAFVLITARIKPYLTRQLNDLEQISLISSSITIYCGFFFLSSISSNTSTYQPQKDFQLNDDSKWFFFSLIIISNMIFLLSWLVAFCGEMKEKIRGKCPKVYICCFLRCKRDRLKEQLYRVKKINLKESIVDQIQNIERKIKQCKSKINSGITFQDQQKFQNWILQNKLFLEKLIIAEVNEKDRNKKNEIGNLRKNQNNLLKTTHSDFYQGSSVMNIRTEELGQDEFSQPTLIFKQPQQYSAEQYFKKKTILQKKQQDNQYDLGRYNSVRPQDLSQAFQHISSSTHKSKNSLLVSPQISIDFDKVLHKDDSKESFPEIIPRFQQRPREKFPKNRKNKINSVHPKITDSTLILRSDQDSNIGDSNLTIKIQTESNISEKNVMHHLPPIRMPIRQPKIIRKASEELFEELPSFTQVLEDPDNERFVALTMRGDLQGSQQRNKFEESKKIKRVKKLNESTKQYKNLRKPINYNQKHITEKFSNYDDKTKMEKDIIQQINRD